MVVGGWAQVGGGRGREVRAVLLLDLQGVQVVHALDPEGQRQRLARLTKAGARWAVACMTQATGTDGKAYKMLVLSRRSIPMWAATVDASRVRKDVRPKLVAYQDEVADILAERFLPKSPSLTGRAALQLLVSEALGASKFDIAADLIDIGRAMEGQPRGHGSKPKPTSKPKPAPQEKHPRRTPEQVREGHRGRILAFVLKANAEARYPGIREIRAGVPGDHILTSPVVREMIEAGVLENRGSARGTPGMQLRVRSPGDPPYEPPVQPIEVLPPSRRGRPGPTSQQRRTAVLAYIKSVNGEGRGATGVGVRKGVRGGPVVVRAAVRELIEAGLVENRGASGWMELWVRQGPAAETETR